MVSNKFFSPDGTTKSFLSDVIIRSELYCRVYNYVYDPLGVDGSVDPTTGLFVRTSNSPVAADTVTLQYWTLVDNYVSFYTAPQATSTVVLEVASTPEELGDIVAGSAADRAELAADEAEASATSAASSASAANTSASNASTSETNASTSASNAATSASNAAASATNAGVSATAASLSASNASTSATNASNSASAASTSASNAATSASNASTSETNAGTSATNAGVSETNALASENKAEKWAEELEDVEVEPGKYSALHHAAKAATFDPSSYYLKTELDGGQLDNRYYTETEVDTALTLKANKANPVFTGLLTEQVSVSTLTLGATSSVQTYTATGNFTIVDDLASGEFVTMFTQAGGFTPTYPTITWLDSADGTTEPPVAALTKVLYEKIGTTLYGTVQGYVL